MLYKLKMHVLILFTGNIMGIQKQEEEIEDGPTKEAYKYAEHMDKG